MGPPLREPILAIAIATHKNLSFHFEGSEVAENLPALFAFLMVSCRWLVDNTAVSRIVCTERVVCNDKCGSGKRTGAGRCFRTCFRRDDSCVAKMDNAASNIIDL